MKALILWVGFVIAWTAAAVLICSYLDRARTQRWTQNEPIVSR